MLNNLQMKKGKWVSEWIVLNQTDISFHPKSSNSPPPIKPAQAWIKNHAWHNNIYLHITHYSHSSIHLFIHLFIYSFIHSSIHSFIHPSIHPFIHSHIITTSHPPPARAVRVCRWRCACGLRVPGHRRELRSAEWGRQGGWYDRMADPFHIHLLCSYPSIALFVFFNFSFVPLFSNAHPLKCRVFLCVSA